MINFIISSNKEVVVDRIKKSITNQMIKCDIEEKIHYITNDLEKLKLLCNQINSFKVLIFNITTKEDIGLINYIRNTIQDWNSIIIVITKDIKLKDEIIKENLYILDYIDNNKNLEKELNQSLDKINKYYDNRENCLCLEQNRILKKIDYKYIISIEKEKDSKKSIIKTTYGDYVINSTIKDIYKKLDVRFIKLSRSTIANIDQISEYNEIENTVLFKNKSTTSDISRANKKKLIEAIYK